MEFKQFFVEGLFGLYNHTIDFSTSHTPNKRASIIMLYGKNGIGKTTILRMLEGFMRLDFNVFREMQFNKAYLKFSNDSMISVESIYNKQKETESLKVQYNNLDVLLNPKKKGLLNEKDQEKQVNIVNKYGTDMQRFSFEFIDTERLMKINLQEEMMDKKSSRQEGKIDRKDRDGSGFLADKVKRFITDSQVYNARYFTKDEPELFDKILKSIDQPAKINIVDLKIRIKAIAQAENKFQLKRLGIATEKWDKEKLNKILDSEKKEKLHSAHKLAVINSYLEVLASRNNEKTSLAERLLTFENILNKFLMDKEISTSKDNGLEIKSRNNNSLKESQLSTGEYHLLYLTVLALCTTVQGTVIAIDEPEMSMHIGWQNKLINALLQISSKANPQFILATHSPDIATNYSNSLKTSSYDKK